MGNPCGCCCRPRLPLSHQDTLEGPCPDFKPWPSGVPSSISYQTHHHSRKSTQGNQVLHLTFGISTGLNYSQSFFPLVYLTKQIG